ncbi:uncharacterized protein [Littorina saxatilis]|uniref:Chitin-binding type-2 domain-containing protein n=1 Tax=Littorina saxatilis TaxID=31220 RepID=A0AAN9B542_9CAEN
MHVLAALMLLALAASQTNAQPATIEYDITNCTAYNFPMGIHHAYHQDCRRFYNCDNNNGGKTTNCADGLLFNRNTYICDFDATCPTWDNAACMNNFGQRDSSRSMMFPALCCRQYFEYQCADGGTWTHKYCPNNQQFDPNTRQCSAGYSGDCTQCGSAATVGSDPCEATHMEFIDACHFRSTAVGIDTVRWCPQGTTMSQQMCRCVASNDQNSCKQNTQQCIENDKAEMRFDVGRFNVPLMTPMNLRWVEWKNGAVSNTNGGQFNQNSYMDIVHFKGNDLNGESAFRIAFSPDLNNLGASDTPIVSTGAPGDSNCAMGSQVTLNARRNGNGVRISFQVRGYNPSTQTQTVAEIAADVSSGTIRLVAVIQADVDGNLVLRGRVKVNNGQAQEMSGQNTQVSNLSSISQVCGMQIGRFTGTVSEFAFWKCTAPTALLNTI